MPRPILRADQSIGVDLNRQNQCVIALPGENLSARISTGDVEVIPRSTGRPVRVQTARAIQTGGDWILVIITDSLPRRFGDTEEVEVTVTNPDTGEESDPPTEVIVVEDDLPFAGLATKTSRGKTKSPTVTKKAPPKAAQKAPAPGGKKKQLTKKKKK